MTVLSLSDFDYDLPPEQIAQYPLQNRTEARLLCVHKQQGVFEDMPFQNLKDRLCPGDVLVLNDTRVLPARLFGKRPSGGKVEVFLLTATGPRCWRVLMKPGRKIREGEVLSFENPPKQINARVLDSPSPDSAEREIEFQEILTQELLESLGHMPLPPYIRREDEPEDHLFYQTVFARQQGAVAAPTAGLHFDESLLLDLRRYGVEIVFLTLHVGYGTFRPVQTEDLSKHDLLEEAYVIDEQTASKINQAKREGRRIVACGTTTVRALESAVKGGTELSAEKGTTSLFIYPPFEFKIVDALLTNFHLPRSSLLLLVAAFAGQDLTMAAYRKAVVTGYRFYSYGDAMLIV